jgi:hypothetical protein
MHEWLWWRKREANRSLARPRRRRVYDIKMYLNATGQGSLNWINLTPDRETWRAVVNTVMNIQVPQNAKNLLIS